MVACSKTDFQQRYDTHLKHLKLKGLQPKTIEAYARAIRRIGAYFDHQVHELSAEQLTDYFTELLTSHAWSAVKLDLYGLKFYYAHVLRRPWGHLDLIKPPTAQRRPDILTVAETERLIQATHTLSYRVFFFTLYSPYHYPYLFLYKTAGSKKARQNTHLLVPKSFDRVATINGLPSRFRLFVTRGDYVSV